MDSERFRPSQVNGRGEEVYREYENSFLIGEREVKMHWNKK